MFADSEPRTPRMTKYGPAVQGRRNKLIRKPIKNAQIGEVALFRTFFICGLQEVGTSILKYFQYQK
jgi:hypothetical protein